MNLHFRKDPDYAGLLMGGRQEPTCDSRGRGSPERAMGTGGPLDTGTAPSRCPQGLAGDPPPGVAVVSGGVCTGSRQLAYDRAVVSWRTLQLCLQGPREAGSDLVPKHTTPRVLSRLQFSQEKRSSTEPGTWTSRSAQGPGRSRLCFSGGVPSANPPVAGWLLFWVNHTCT